MRGRTILTWGIVAVDRAYLGTSYSLDARFLSTTAGRSSTTLKMSQHTGSLEHSAEHSAEHSVYRAVLEKEVIEKKMTLATNPEALNRMIDTFYIPVYAYLKCQLEEHEERYKGLPRPPLFIGISAPQGLGKTTLTNFMRTLFAKEGKNSIAVSLDDFYLTGREQEEVARNNAGNPLLQFRGNAGTHDLALTTQTLSALRGLEIPPPTVTLPQTPHTADTEREVLIPQYDKSLRGGRGDRADVSHWIHAKVPVDVVMFEGWMLGFKPINDDTLSQEMETINSILRQYKPLHELFDAWLLIAVENYENGAETVKTNSVEMGANGIIKGKSESKEAEKEFVVEEGNQVINHGINEGIKGVREGVNGVKGGVIRYSHTPPAGINAVFQWRLQAEKMMKIGLTDKQVEDFVSRFMPAYLAYLPALYSNGPEKRLGKEEVKGEIPVFKVTVDINRFPITSELL